MLRADSVRRLSLLAFGSILLLAGLLRVWNLQLRGLFFWDEAKFALEGVRMQQVLLHAAGRPALFSAGKTIGTAKPGHALFIGLGYLAFGIHAWVPLALSAAFSLMALCLLFEIGRRLVGVPAALAAVALLAVSRFDIIYSRSALSESDATALFLAGFLVWLLSRSTDRVRLAMPCLAASGVLFGFAFSTNYRLLLYIASIGALDVVLSFRDRGPAIAAGRVTLLGVGCLVVPSLWQWLGTAEMRNHLFLFRNEFDGSGTTYFHEVLYQLHGGKQSVFRFQPLPYLQWFWVRQGPVVSVLTVAGLVRAMWDRSRTALLIAGPAVVPFVLFVFAPFVVPRNLVAALPFTSLLAAWGAVWPASLPRPRSVGWSVSALLLIAAVALGASGSWQLTAERSGFAAAASLIRQRGARQALTTSEVTVFYFRGDAVFCDTPSLPLRLSNLFDFVRAGYRYAVIDRHSSPAVRYVRSHAREIGSFLTAGPIHIGEDIVSSENTNPPRAGDPPDRVFVYDLSPLVPAPEHPPLPPYLCVRDLVT